MGCWPVKTAAPAGLACFVEAVSERDRALLDDLETAGHEKRRQLRRRVAPMFELLGLSLVFAGLLSINSMPRLPRCPAGTASKESPALDRRRAGAGGLLAACSPPAAPAISWRFFYSRVPGARAAPDHEVVSWKLALLLAFRRGLWWLPGAAIRAGSHAPAGREWMRQAESLELPGLHVPAFVIQMISP